MNTKEKIQELKIIEFLNKHQNDQLSLNEVAWMLDIKFKQLDDFFEKYKTFYKKYYLY